TRCVAPCPVSRRQLFRVGRPALQSCDIADCAAPHPQVTARRRVERPLDDTQRVLGSVASCRLKPVAHSLFSHRAQPERIACCTLPSGAKQTTLPLTPFAGTS